MKNGYPSRRKTYEHGAKMSEVYELSLDYEGGGYPEELLLHRAWMELSCQYPDIDRDWALRGGMESLWKVGWLSLPYKMSGAILHKAGKRSGRPNNWTLQMVSEATNSPSSCMEQFHCRVVASINSSALSIIRISNTDVQKVQCVECGEGGFPAGPKCGWFRIIILSPLAQQDFQ